MWQQQPYISKLRAALLSNLPHQAAPAVPKSRNRFSCVPGLVKLPGHRQHQRLRRRRRRQRLHLLGLLRSGPLCWTPLTPRRKEPCRSSSSRMGSPRLSPCQKEQTPTPTSWTNGTRWEHAHLGPQTSLGRCGRRWIHGHDPQDRDNREDSSFGSPDSSIQRLPQPFPPDSSVC